jgi:hypothetical protein
MKGAGHYPECFYTFQHSFPERAFQNKLPLGGIVHDRCGILYVQSIGAYQMQLRDNVGC